MRVWRNAVERRHVFIVKGPTQIKEQQIIDYQETHKIERRRAVQMMNGPTSHRRQPKYGTHFKCSMSEENKRRITLWMLETAVRQKLSRRPKSIKAI